MSPSVEQLPVKNLEPLLAETLGNNFQIKHVEWKPLTDPGENFGSVILAINVTILRDNKSEILNLVAKLPPRLEYLLELFNSPVTFRKELLFYNSVVTELINLQREAGVAESDLCMIAPKFLGGRLGLKNADVFDNQATIVLENLKYSNYFTGNRIYGLDKKHAEFAVRELAKMHAITVAVKIKKPETFENKLLPLLKQAVDESAIKCVKDMVHKACEDLKNIPEAEPYMRAVEKTIEHGIELYGQSGDVEEPWGTLVHNDFWVNNMMYQHDASGEILDMKMVDFQLCTYGYGMCDLIFFLMSSIRNEVLEDYLTDMVDLYYDSFVNCLQTLNVDKSKFPKEKFMELLNRCGPLKFIQSIMMVQVIQATRDSNQKQKTMEEDANSPEDIFINQSDNSICKQKMLHILKMFDKRGWLIK